MCHIRSFIFSVRPTAAPLQTLHSHFYQKYIFSTNTHSSKNGFWSIKHQAVILISLIWFISSGFRSRMLKYSSKQRIVDVFSVFLLPMFWTRTMLARVCPDQGGNVCNGMSASSVVSESIHRRLCARHVKFMFCAAFLKEPWNGFQGKICWSNGRNEQAQLDGCKTKQRNGDREREKEERERKIPEERWKCLLWEKGQKWRLSHPETHSWPKPNTEVPNPICWDTIAQRKIQTVY